MKSITPSSHYFPHTDTCCPPSAVKRALAHFKPVCIAATVAVALFVVVYSTVKAQPVMEGIAAILLIILSVNAAHSGAQAGIAAFAGKKAATAADSALNAAPAAGGD